jgi:hypothetical protein
MTSRWRGSGVDEDVDGWEQFSEPEGAGHTVNRREVQVQENDVRCGLAGYSQSLGDIPAGGDHFHLAAFVEQRGHHRSDQEVVVDDQDLRPVD